MKETFHAHIALCVVAVLLPAVLFAQTAGPGAQPQGATTIGADGKVDCAAAYPGTDQFTVGLRKQCEEINNGIGTNPSQTLEMLDSARDGIYGCNGIARYGPVGQQRAQGTYVPVSEEAVALNTFILVNKVCVLDAVARNNRNALIAGLERAQIKAINEGGPDGRPRFARDVSGDLYGLAKGVAAEILTNGEFGNMCPSFSTSTQKTIARDWERNINRPYSALACSFPGGRNSQQRFVQGSFSEMGYAGLTALIDPANSADSAYILGSIYIDDSIKAAQEDYLRDLSYGNGFLSSQACEKVPVGNGKYEESCGTVTPGRLIADTASYLSLSGNRLVESADEINKMVGTMFANLASQILSSATGFAGTTQSQNGAPSYLDGAVNSAYQAAQTETLTTGVEALQRALTIETTYVSLRTNSKKSLETAKAQIENLEKSCVTTLAAQAKIDIRKQVQDQECGAQEESLSPTCNVTINITEKEVDGTLVLDARGPTKRVVTALKAPDKATAIVTGTIQPMLDIVTTSLNNAQKGLALLKQLEASVRGASSPQMVAYVIAQLNQLITAKVLHTEGDVASARDQQSKITDTMQSIYDRTKEQWEADWCQASKWQTLVVPTPTLYR